MTTKLPSDVHVIGAGPAGLAAAIHLGRAGLKPVVFERADDVGARFHGDFQGLENWSSAEDATDFLRGLGIEINFLCAPYRKGTCFGPSGRGYALDTPEPLFYLVERGNGPGSLDQGLKQQAIEAGAEIRFGQQVEHALAEKVIVATGPRTPDAIARGVLFETAHEDGYYALLGDALAPCGYAYLLIHAGRATLATCLFKDFERAHEYLGKVLDFVRRRLDVDVRRPRPFGGYVSFGVDPPWSRNGRLFFVGERAGFQDALFGFGIRHAVHSGTLAADAILTGEDYDALCREHILPHLQTSVANRLVFNHLADNGYEYVLRHLDRRNVIALMRRHHEFSPVKRGLYAVARKRFNSQPEEACDDEDCSCIWCEHGAEDAANRACVKIPDPADSRNTPSA